MGAVLVIQNIGQGAGGGGSDATPDALDWANIGPVTQYFPLAPSVGLAEPIAGIDTLINLRMAWTSTADTPTMWVYKNGFLISKSATSPINFSVVVDDEIHFGVQAWNEATTGVGRFVTGTITITNQSDAGATLDTFTYNVTYTPLYFGPGL